MNTRNLRFRSNRVRDILALFHEELDPLYGPGEVSAFGEMLFEAFLGWDRVKLLTSKEQTVNQSDLLRLHWALEDLKRHRPIQHIIGHVDFCGCRIAVGPDVLIPRPETEEIVNFLVGSGKWGVDSSQGQALPTSHSQLNTEHCSLNTEHCSLNTEHCSLNTEHCSLNTENILDLCTGSGCIAIALKKAFPAADVTAVDISPAALAIARRNAQENHTEVHFLQADVLADPPEKTFTSHLSPFTLIVSNPPYVMEKERAQMQRNVLDYEPQQALFVPDDDPLRFYHAIALIAQRHLATDGLLALEINEALASDTCALLLHHGFDPTVHQDFRGRDRLVTARPRL